MASAEEIEIKTKVEALAKARYGDSSPASLKRLFLSYDRDGDGLANADEIKELYVDADVGSGLSRGFYVDGTIDAMDKNGDRKVSWQEYAAAAGLPAEDPLKGGGGTTPTLPSYPTYDQWKKAQAGAPVAAPEPDVSEASISFGGVLPWVAGAGLLVWWLRRRAAR